jgi:hypothetical protein
MYSKMARDGWILLKSALKFVTLYWQIAVFSRRIATEKIAVPRTAIVRGPNLRAECHGPDSLCVTFMRFIFNFIYFEF